MEKITKRVNRAISKFLPASSGFAYGHLDLEGNIPGFYRQDGIHLSDNGIDLFNLGLQNCIEMVAVLV